MISGPGVLKVSGGDSDVPHQVIVYRHEHEVDGVGHTEDDARRRYAGVRERMARDGIEVVPPERAPRLATVMLAGFQVGWRFGLGRVRIRVAREPLPELLKIGTRDGSYAIYYRERYILDGIGRTPEDARLDYEHRLERMRQDGLEAVGGLPPSTSTMIYQGTYRHGHGLILIRVRADRA